MHLHGAHVIAEIVASHLGERRVVLGRVVM